MTNFRIFFLPVKFSNRNFILDYWQMTNFRIVFLPVKFSKGNLSLELLAISVFAIIQNNIRTKFASFFLCFRVW